MTKYIDDQMVSDVGIDQSQLIYVAVTIGLSLLWLFNQAISVAYGKNYLQICLNWLSKRPVLLPSLSALLLPFIVPGLIINLTTQKTPDFFKLILPIATFIAGQFLNNRQKAIESRNKQIELFLSIKRKIVLSKNKNKDNLKFLEVEILQLDLYKSTEGQDGGFLEISLSQIEVISNEYSQLELISILTGKNLISVETIFRIMNFIELSEKVNQRIKDRENYRSRCREVCGTEGSSIELIYRSFDLLMSNDREIFKMSKSLNVLIEEILIVELNP